VAFFVFFNGLLPIASFLTTPTAAATEAIVSPTPDHPTETAAPVITESPSPTSEVTETPISPTPTLATASISSPAPPGEVLKIFDQNNADSCQVQTTNISTSLEYGEGFLPRADNNWRFAIKRGRTLDEYIQVDFGQCFDPTQLKSMAVNMWVPRLELQRDFTDIKEPGKEVGFFIENENGQRREYTIWIDATESMHLRVREGEQVILDQIVSIVNIGVLKIKGEFPRFYAEFPIQIFFERNNNGWDAIYLKQGPVLEAVTAQQLDPADMIPLVNATLPTMEEIQKIGLIGYGGETQTVIWPLVFFGK
jgi:hypothetical protein